MRDVPVIPLMILLGMSCGAPGWVEDAFGTWMINPARSQFAGDTRPKNVMVRIEPHARGEIFTLDTIGEDGRATTSSTILYFDSRPRDFQEPQCSGTQSSRRVDSSTVEIMRTCASGARTRFVRRLAAQPKEMVLEITEQQPDGRRFERFLVLEKQSEAGTTQNKQSETERRDK